MRTSCAASLLLLAVVLGASCAETGGYRRAPAIVDPYEDRLNTLEARLIGLTDELDRLGRRVVALERGGAPEEPAEPAAEEEAETGAWTAILVDGRLLVGTGISSTRHDRWRLVDPEKRTIFAHEDVPEAVREVRPIFWIARAGTPIGASAIPHLGARPYVVDAVDGSMAELPEGQAAVLELDAQAAAALREEEAFRSLVTDGKLVILLRE